MSQCLQESKRGCVSKSKQTRCREWVSHQADLDMSFIGNAPGIMLLTLDKSPTVKQWLDLPH